jgi:aminotransferase in exopolysaccharide biosynthesis
MKTNLSKIVIQSIKKVLGNGKHRLHEPFFFGNEVKYLKKTILDNSVSSIGDYVKKFEERIKKITKSKFAIAVVNGTEALHISLKVAGVKNNEEVLVPALTFVGTVNAITYCGGIPHFVDSENNTLGIDTKKLEQYLNNIVKLKKNIAINKFTKRVIRAILPVHIFGHPCEINEITRIAKKFNLIVIEDAAEALGSYYKKKHLGTFGIAGCLSFNGNKIITTGGGGAVITNNKKFAKKVRHLSTTAKINHKWEYIHDEIGYNFRMPNLNAALGLAQLESLDFFIKKKRILYKKYFEVFKNFDNIYLLKELENAKSNYWLQTLVLKKNYYTLKNKILTDSFKSGLYLRPAWKLISNLNPYSKNPKMNLMGSEEIYKRVINLPSGQSILFKK